MADITAQRVVKGAQNFRQVSCARTRDGRRLRRGQLWRSARLDQLTAADCETVAGLGIRLIADLRTSDERARWPTNPLLLRRTKVLFWDVVRLARDQQPGRSLASVSQNPAAARDVVIQAYQRIVEDHVTQLRDLYQAIADEQTPVLIHCAAGKDRTGVAVGILLDLLGVERSAILDDYELSERYLDWSQMDLAATLGIGARAVDVPTAVSNAIVRSDRAYLEAAFAWVGNRFGSTEGFVETGLGLSHAAVVSIRRHLIDG